MADLKLKRTFNDKEAEIIIKDAVTAIMLDYALGDTDVENIKAYAYTRVANVIVELDMCVSNLSTLMIESIKSSELKKTLRRKINGEKNDK